MHFLLPWVLLNYLPSLRGSLELAVLDEKKNFELEFWFHFYVYLLNQARKAMAGGPAHPEIKSPMAMR